MLNYHDILKSTIEKGMIHMKLETITERAKINKSHRSHYDTGHYKTGRFTIKYLPRIQDMDVYMVILNSEPIGELYKHYDSDMFMVGFYINNNALERVEDVQSLIKSYSRLIDK